jgi:hypothetical protein
LERFIDSAARAQAGGWKWERVMIDPLNTADRYRAVASEFADLARNASSDFPRAYYQRISERYQLLAEGGSVGQDEATPAQDLPAAPPPCEMKPKPAGKSGFVHAVRKVARRVSLRKSRRAN